MSLVFAPSRPVRGLALGDLAREIAARGVTGDASVQVTGVRQDSRTVEPGDLFAMRAGLKARGSEFAGDAIARGAVALLAEPSFVGDAPVPVVSVDDVRVGLARAASAVYGHPTFALDVVGITGTNGKTTTAWLARTAIEGAGGRAGMIGTLGTRFEGWELPGSHTTPEADDLARIASEMLARGATHLVMEVSSHALAQARVEATRFRVAAFTNLTQDHLDFHGTMDAYGDAKARLFVDLGPGAAVIDVDDPFGRALAARVRAPTLTVSAVVGARADVVPVALSPDPRRTRARVRTPSGEVELDSSLVGAHNLSNLLAALAIVSALDLDVARGAEALSGAVAVPGRLERCDGPGDDVLVLVDYAHTPDALARALAAVRPLTGGRVLCVFGCGGDRDRAKRPRMGEAVARAADVAFVTSDNPRSEDARSIVDAILPGTAGARALVHVEIDRARAIARAVGEAAPGDVVLVAGKGHETYQVVGDVTRHFDDREEARAALALRRGRAG